MENIEANAKNELLNIQDPDQSFSYEPFVLNITSNKQKTKTKVSSRAMTTLSSHRDVPTLQKQNNKEILKQKLKKLLQKQIQSPKFQLSKMKTIDSQRSVKKSQTYCYMPRIKFQQEEQKMRGSEKSSILSIRKENARLSTKNLKSLESLEKNRKQLFQEENEQIRKFIKKKMQQKLSQKQKKTIQSTNALQSLHKMKTLIHERAILTQNNDEEIRTKLKIRGIQTTRNLLKQIVYKNQSSKNKQNLNLVSAFSTPMMRRQKQNIYQSRKLRNILF